MCEAVVPEVKPLNVTWTCSVPAVGSSVIVAEPFAVDTVGGTSSAGVRFAVKVIGLADVAAAGSIRAAISINTLSRRMTSSPLRFIDQALVAADARSWQQHVTQVGGC